MTHAMPANFDLPRSTTTVWHSPAYQAYRLLQVAFVVAPIVAGFDKFFHLLVNWDMYLAPVIDRAVGGHGHQLMLAAGVVEIIAGLGVLFMPRVFGYIVAAWLLAIIINLLLVPGFYDIALRDVGLCLGALALARLSCICETTDVMPPKAA